MVSVAVAVTSRRRPGRTWLAVSVTVVLAKDGVTMAWWAGAKWRHRHPQKQAGGGPRAGALLGPPPVRLPRVEVAPLVSTRRLPRWSRPFSQVGR